MECVFCQIAAGKLPADILYQDEEVISFRDTSPQSPTHLLIVSKRHIPSLAHLSDADTPLVAHMIKIANQLAREQGISESGYRLVINSGEAGGQVVPHLHLHLLAGRKLSVTMG